MEVEGDGAGEIGQDERAGRRKCQQAEQDMAGAAAAEQVGNRGDFARVAGGDGVVPLEGSRAFGNEGRGLKGLVAEDALVGDVVSLAEQLGFLGGRGEK